MISRRKFLKNTSLASAGIFLADKLETIHPYEKASAASYDILKEASKYRKIDAHEHVGMSGPIEYQLNMADRFGIEKLVVSKVIYADSGSKTTPEEFRACNDEVLKAMKNYPDKYMGWCFINPLFGKESLEEINRCVGEGMVGLKVYNQVKIKPFKSIIWNFHG